MQAWYSMPPHTKSLLPAGTSSAVSSVHVLQLDHKGLHVELMHVHVTNLNLSQVSKVTHRGGLPSFRLNQYFIND